MEYDTFSFEKVSIAEAIESLKGDDTPIKHEEDWNAKRNPELSSDRRLTEMTAAWLLALPVEIRPLQLARNFPRIVNRLSGVWQRPVNCDKVFEDLMIDNRGTRRGFSLEIAKEITELRAYYNTVICVDRQELWTLTL